MSVYNGKFNVQEFTNVVNITNDQTIITSNGIGFGPLSGSQTIGPVYNYASQTLKVDKIDAAEYINLPDGVDVAEYDYDNPSTQMLLTVDKNNLTGDITTSTTGIEYDYNNNSLKVNGNIDIKSVNNIKYHNNNQYQDTHYKPFPDMVRAFFEMTNENDFMYDYSGNGVQLDNRGALWSKNGAYFATNEDVRYRTQYQEDMRRIELRGAKLNELLSSINAEFSITFDFTPLENDSVIMQLTNSNNTQYTHFTIKIASNGFLNVVLSINNGVQFSLSTSSPITLNKPHHFCFNSRAGTSYVYLDNVLVGSDTKVIDINNYVFESLVIGCEKLRTDIKYSYPYAGWISNFMITSEYIGDTVRTAIYNNDYGYDIVILSGQSNCVGRALCQEGIDNDYSEIDGIVYQYDFNTDSIIKATNQLKHYTPSYMSGNGSVYLNEMGAWLEFIKNYIKYYKKSSNRKVLIIPCALGGSSFTLHWRTGLPMINNLIANTNKCTGYSKLNKIIGMLWYQGESEAFDSNASFETDLHTLRTNLINNINGFTEVTPVIVTLINNKRDIDNTILGQPANQFVNNTMVSFANTYGYGVVDTEDLKLNGDDWIHLNAPSLRIVGQRWYDEFCKITNIDNKSKAIIKTVDKTEMSDLTVDNLRVKDIDILNDETYDIDIESYLPIKKGIDITTSIPIRVSRAFYQPKTDDIWLLPIGSLLTFKYFNVKTKKLIELTNWGTIFENALTACMYKDKLYVLNNSHKDTWVQDEIMPNADLYIIDTLNYTMEKITNFAIKTSGIGTDWTVPSDSSSNVAKSTIQTVSYSSIFAYNDKLYFIPYAQQDIGIFDLKTRVFDQTTFALGYVGGFFGSVFNPSNKCLYLSRAYKVGADAGWDIPYLDFSSSTPTLSSVELPSNYVGFRGGAFCHTNGSVYIPMGTTNNAANAYVLKITSSNTASALTLGGEAANKQFNSSLYSPDDRIILHSGGTLYRIKPTDDTLDSNISITSGRFIQCFDKYGVLYSFANSESSSYGMYKFPITVNNKDIINPTFNCQR